MVNIKLKKITSYVKLQDTYAVEKNNLGTWSQIGYTAPGNKGVTSNFTYSDQGKEAASGVVGGGEGGWKAVSMVGLNDCQKSSEWTVISGINAKTGAVTNKAGASDKPNCIDALTPNFCEFSSDRVCGASGATPTASETTDTENSTVG